MKIGKVKTNTFFCILLSSVLFPITSSVGQVTSLFVENYPQSYIVQEDDTIGDIASQFLVDPDNWDDVWSPAPGNEDEAIDPGDIIRVDFINGSPKLISQRGDVVVERLSPEMREIALLGSIPEIPLDLISSSFTTNRIVPEEMYLNAPYIVSPTGSNLVIGSNDEVFARGNWGGEGEFFEIYRQINNFNDPESNDPLGVELETVGYANIISNEGDEVKRLLISGSKREIKIGDRLLIREESRLDPTIYPTEPTNNIQARILAMTNTERMASQLDTILIDAGGREGLVIGNILSIEQPGPLVVDTTNREQKNLAARFSSVLTNEKIEMPSQEIGTLLIYRVFDRMSYGVILSSTEPSRIGDVVSSQ
jgi:hypothetical protein